MVFKKSDFENEQEIRWCPGCGDYAILATVQRTLPLLGIPKENFVFISGIGCAGRFPYYMNTYGFHSIHGRAPALATGLKIMRPELSVWVVTGDGDALSIGGNHFIHLLRRNVGIKVLLFNNRIYGLTKGQYSPTSPQGKQTNTSPFGTIERPLDPVALAFAAGATFIARVIDIDAKGLSEVILRAAEHEGTALIEIYQNCNIFNDGAFQDFSEKSVRSARTLWVEEGKPMVFGPDKNQGLRFRGTALEVFGWEGHSIPADCLIYDKKDLSLGLALSQCHYPEYPEPLGILYQASLPTFESRLMGTGVRLAECDRRDEFMKLLRQGQVWKINF